MLRQAYYKWRYERQVSKEFSRSEELRKLAELLGSAGKNVGILTHNDVDGLTSAMLLKKLLERIDVKRNVKINVLKAFKEQYYSKFVSSGRYDVIFVLDLGVKKEMENLGKNVVVLDHHNVNSWPEACLVLNSYKLGMGYAPTVFMVHKASTYLGLSDDDSYLLALLGCQADLAVNSSAGTYYANLKWFYLYCKSRWKFLFDIHKGYRTRFDLDAGTTPLNMIVEALDVALKARIIDSKYGLGLGVKNSIAYAFKVTKRMVELVSKGGGGAFDFEKTLKDVGDGLLEMVECYREEVERGLKLVLANRRKISSPTGLLYVSQVKDVSFLASVANLALYDIVRESGEDDAVLVVVNSLNDGTLVLSRSLGEKVNLHRLMQALAGEIRLKYSVEADGGGHAKAASCFVRSTQVKAPDIERALVACFKKLASSSLASNA